MHMKYERLFILAWRLLDAPISALISAWAASKLWTWFLSSQYGAGPSIGAWFGALFLFYLASLGIAQAVSNLKSEGAAHQDTVSGAIGESIGHWILVGGLLGLAFGTGSIFGWIQ